MSTRSPEEILAIVAAGLLAEPGSAGGKGGLFVGLSGGADSTALLSLLVEAGASPLRAIHVDHGLRPQAEREAEARLVRELCGRLGVGLTLARVRPGAIEARALARGEGIEAAARHYRYHAFSQALASHGGGLLYLAHTLDDQVETILMRALSGAGAGGLKGMAERSGHLRRPLLGIHKAELAAWLSSRSLAWSEDSTNATEAYARNRIRHLVLPGLAKAWPSWEGGLLTTAAKARAEEEALEVLGRPMAFSLDPAGRWIAPLALLGAPWALRERAFLFAAGKLLGEARISSRLARAAFGALGSGKGSYRGGGFVLSARPEGLELGLALDFPGRAGYFVQIDDPGSRVLVRTAGGRRVRVEWVEAGKGTGLREAAFSFPLVIRSRRPGDRLSIPGGSKSIDALLAEWGLGVADRDRVPLVEDRDGIVAVLGGPQGGRNRFRPGPGGEGERLLSLHVKGA